MNKKYIGTKNLLFSIINKAEIETVDYAIAHYLLEHYKTIQDINIYDMAENCFINRTTVLRFFKKYGFDNFLDFKNHYVDDFEEKDVAPILFQDYASYINDLNAKILDMMDQFSLKRDKTQEIEFFNQHIYNSNKIVLMGDESFYGQLYHAQQSMIGLNKVVHLVTNHISDNKVLKSLTQDDCLIVFSLKGNYFEAIKTELEKIHAYKMMLTLHVNESWKPYFNYISQLTKQPEKADEAVYRKYGVTYFIDTMMSTYRMKYKL